MPATYRYTGENIASGDKGVTVGSLHAALMRSDGHRANILAPGFTHIGIGVHCSAAGKIFITEDFSRPTFAGDPPPWAGTPPVAPIVRGDAGVIALDDVALDLREIRQRDFGARRGHLRPETGLRQAALPSMLPQWLTAQPDRLRCQPHRAQPCVRRQES